MDLDPAIQDFYDAIPRGLKVGLTGAQQQAKPGGDAPIEPGGDGSLPYRAFKARHPTYDARHWRKMRALYEGGRRLCDPQMLTQVLARNNREPEDVYAWRMAQAFYVNYCSELIDYIVQVLVSDPARILKDGKPLEGDTDAVANWAKDLSQADAQHEIPVDSFVQDLVTEAMVVDVAWVLLDRPVLADDAPPPESLLDAEKLGLTRTCSRVVAAEEVIHWEIDARSKRLKWALLCTVDMEYPDFYSAPIMVETYTRYDDTTFTQWEVRYPKGAQILDDAMIAPKPGCVNVPHGFSRNPLRRFVLPAGLRAMSKLATIATAIFNKWCALDVAERRSLLPALYEFQGTEHGTKAAPVSIAQKDAARAVNTPRSPHHVQVRGKDDRAEFVGPSAEPFTHALNSIKAMKEEMHRILYQMSLATDGGSRAAVGRSGESKQEDRISSVLIASSVGKLVIVFLGSLVPDVLFAAGTKDPKAADAYTFDGYKKFDTVSEGEIISDTQVLEALNIPSQTARREIFMRMLRRVLDNLDEESLAGINDEIAGNLTAEQMIQKVQDVATVATAKAAAAGAGAEPEAPQPPGAPKPPEAPKAPEPPKPPQPPKAGPKKKPA